MKLFFKKYKKQKKEVVFLKEKGMGKSTENILSIAYFFIHKDDELNGYIGHFPVNFPKLMCLCYEAEKIYAEVYKKRLTNEEWITSKYQYPYNSTLYKRYRSFAYKKVIEVNQSEIKDKKVIEVLEAAWILYKNLNWEAIQLKSRRIIFE